MRVREHTVRRSVILYRLYLYCVSLSFLILFLIYVLSYLMPVRVLMKCNIFWWNPLFSLPKRTTETSSFDGTTIS